VPVIGVSLGRAESSFSLRSSLIGVPSSLQKLVKSVRQLKDLQDIFSFRYTILNQGRKHTEG
jgi:hypothetical protein